MEGWGGWRSLLSFAGCFAERDQQLDLATRVCEALVRRVEEAERTVAVFDADQREREESAKARSESGSGGAASAAGTDQQEASDPTLSVSTAAAPQA